MGERVSLGELFGAYRAHFSTFDGFIISLGFLTLFAQLVFFLWARAALLRPPGALHFPKSMFLRLVERLFASVVEIFTLLGLLGTVFSLLYTFGLLEGADDKQVLRSFAPAFTTTISGLLCAITNKLLYDTALSPMLEVLLARQPSSEEELAPEGGKETQGERPGGQRSGPSVAPEPLAKEET